MQRAIGAIRSTTGYFEIIRNIAQNKAAGHTSIQQRLTAARQFIELSKINKVKKPK